MPSSTDLFCSVLRYLRSNYLSFTHPDLAPPPASFMNGPVTGSDVFIPMDMIIGGQTRLGFGWNMLMVSRKSYMRNIMIENL